MEKRFSSECPYLDDKEHSITITYVPALPGEVHIRKVDRKALKDFDILLALSFDCDLEKQCPYSEDCPVYALGRTYPTDLLDDV